MDNISNQYQEAYFSWQSKVGEFGGKANLFKFEKHIQPSDKVLDYGCGGGYLLKTLNCDIKVGLDVNPVIQSPDGVTILKNIEEVSQRFGTETFDVVISNHALEHIDNPANALKECFQMLKPGGKIIIVVPSESHRIKYVPDDINKHIVTFAPMNLGNLLTLTGFKVINVKRLFHKWPPRYESIANINWKLFHCTSYIYGLYKSNSIQLIAIAEKPI
jgi:2-polyprenyl-3-methyl-5-hydroxy-6-metoxy-1,4-benzoquinol methylase